MIIRCHHDMFDRYGIYVAQITTDMFRLSQALPRSLLIPDFSPSL